MTRSSIEERKFTIRDEEGLKVGRIRRTEAGLTEKRFKADHYVVMMHRPLEEPLRTLVIGAALAIDLALE